MSAAAQAFEHRETDVRNLNRASINLAPARAVAAAEATAPALPSVSRLLSGGFAVRLVADGFPIFAPTREHADALLARHQETSAAAAWRDLGKAVGPVGHAAAGPTLPSP
ncbi:hypothetical protein AB0L22_08600 [Micromonospora haikouensis]|uniref:hypothetical protein n=1 Tax=Micromonospora haikouensis TaxID=686309 RepID=UPI0034130ECF